MAYPVDKAWLVGVMVEGMLYGIHIVLFAFSFAILTWKRGSRSFNWLILLSTCVIFVASTVHFSIAFSKLITAFITKRNVLGGPLAVINTVDTLLPINAMFSINNFLGDSLLTYRCWLVWQKDWRIILAPVLLLFLYAASATVGLYNFHQEGRHLVASPGWADFGTASFAISLALNLLMTSLVAGRIYYMARKHRAIFSSRHTRQYMAIISIILESGALFTAAQVVFLAIFQTSAGTGVDAIAALMTAQIYCIVPTLVIVRVGSGSSYETTTASGSLGTEVSSMRVNAPMFKLHNMGSSESATKTSMHGGDTRVTASSSQLAIERQDMEGSFSESENV